MQNEPIDIVYLWVDGSDEKWAKTKAEWMERTTGKNNLADGAMHVSRFRDNGEFVHSLRSVAECAPWIHHIYIITGFGQVPKWLNTNHPKITMISHEQIMPADAIPTFNASAIEMCIPNIPGLSEHFLLMNDDMFFNRPVDPDFFFDADGRALVRYSRMPRRDYSSNTYTNTLMRSCRVITKATGRNVYGMRPSHGIDPYIKSSWIECAKNPTVAPYIDRTTHNRFRTDDDIQRWAFNLYDYACGRAEMIHVPSYKSTRSRILNFIYNTRRARKLRNAPIYTTDANSAARAIGRAPIFCINDTPNSPENVHLSNAEFLEWRFPNKCEFEK